MSQLPINPLSPEQQQKIMEQMYLLMGKQVQSYHKHRHMGNNSSIPIELAQELMESIAYTINLVGGVYAHQNIDEAFTIGQQILESRLSKAKSMLELVNSTAPQWQTDCRWEALSYLRHYLEHYDPLHLAHQGPDGMFYPILISPPEGIRGIDSCLFYLDILWIENQIMAGVAEEAQEQLWARLPADTLNQCEQLLLCGLGKALLGGCIEPLTFSPAEHLRVNAVLKRATEADLCAAAGRLCRHLALRDEKARQYACTVVAQLSVRRGLPDPGGVFL